MATEVIWHEHQVTRAEREKLNGHRGCVIWFTGLSGCGKSTIANAVDHRLHALGVHTYLLDGDNIRHGLNASPEMLVAQHDAAFAQRFGLGFAAEDREVAFGIQRIAEGTDDLTLGRGRCCPQCRLTSTRVGRFQQRRSSR